MLAKDGSELNLELLQNELNAMAADMKAAFQAIVNLVPEAEDHDDWLTFRRAHSLEVGHRNLWEWVYDKVCAARGAEARETARQARRSSPYADLLGHQEDYASILRNLPVPAVNATYRIISSQRDLARVGALERRISESEADLRALAQERRLAEETYQATRQPEGFTVALQVLAFLAVVGMGVPVAVMGFAPLTLPGWARVIVIALFFAGVGLLLRFLFVYAAYLREGGRKTFPHTAVGLFGRGDRH